VKEDSHNSLTNSDKQGDQMVSQGENIPSFNC